MRKIIEYVTVKNDNIYDLDKTVNDAILLGWQPFIGITSCKGSYIQVLVKYEDKPKLKL